MNKLTIAEAKKRDIILKKLFDFSLSNKSSYLYNQFFSSLKEEKDTIFQDDEIELLLEKIYEDGYIDFQKKMVPLDGFIGGISHKTGVFIKQEGKYLVESGGYISTLEQQIFQTKAAKNAVEDREFDNSVKTAQRTYFNLATAKIIFGVLVLIIFYLVLIFAQVF